MMSYRIIRVCQWLLGACLCFASISASALVVWVVNAGDDPSSNAIAAPIDVSPGIHSFDLYMDTEGEDLYGWDLTFLASGLSTIDTVSGEGLGLGAAQANGGYRQFGADDLALTPLNSSVELVLTLSWNAVAGETLAIASTSSFVDSGFSSQFLTAQTLAGASAIPLPAAIWFFLTGSMPILLVEKLKEFVRSQ